MTLKEYRAKHGRDPSTSVSYKQFAFLRWGISQLVTPDTSFDPAVFKIEHTRLHPEVIDLRAETLLVPRSYAAGTLLPFEIHAVIDVRDHVAQLERLKARIDHARKSAPLAAALTKQKRTTKHTLKPREMWVMLRLVDALRADAARAGWKPKSPLEQFLVPRFQLKNFLDTIKNEAHHARNRATTDVDWLTSTLDLAQLKNWRQDHLLKLLHHRGHTELI